MFEKTRKIIATYKVDEQRWADLLEFLPDMATVDAALAELATAEGTIARLRTAAGALVAADHTYNMHPGCTDKARELAIANMASVLSASPPTSEDMRNKTHLNIATIGHPNHGQPTDMVLVDVNVLRPFGSEPKTGEVFLAYREDAGFMLCLWKDGTLFTAGGEDITDDLPSLWADSPIQLAGSPSLSQEGS